MPIVLGVDLGTTKISCIAVDASSGKVLATDSAANQSNITDASDRDHGYSEWDANAIVATAIQCVRSVARLLESRTHDVVGIGITGQQHGVVLTDAESHNAVSPLINWQDRRSLKLLPGGNTTWLDAARLALGQDAWKRTGCLLHPGFMAVTLFELNQRRLLPANLRALFIMDYFGSVLTNKPAITEPSCAASSGIFDVRKREWSDDAIRTLELPRSVFPDVREANETIGGLANEVSDHVGLPKGTPVFAPIGDHQASFLGSVADRRNSVLVNVGTGAQVAVYTDKFDFQLPIELRPFPCGGNLLSNVGLAGGWSYQVLESFFVDVGRSLYQAEPTNNIYKLMTDLAEKVDQGANGLTCDPTFSGTRLDPLVQGSITGITPQNFTAGHLARAVLHGMSRSLHEGYLAIQKITQSSPTTLIAAGNGLRKNQVLAEIVSSDFGLPITLTEHREEAAFGAAVVASVGANVFTNVEDAARSMIHSSSADNSLTHLYFKKTDTDQSKQ